MSSNSGERLMLIGGFGVQEGEVVSCHGVDALNLRSGKVRITSRSLPLLLLGSSDRHADVSSLCVSR